LIATPAVAEPVIAVPRPMMRPARAGPTTRAELNAIELRAIALARRLRGTRSGASACRSGMSIAFTSPSMPAIASTIQISTTPVAVSRNRMKAWHAAAICEAIIALRFSIRSANTPPNGARSMAGPNCRTATKPSCRGEPPRARTSHGRLTCCIQVPIRLTTWPLQYRR
jgi:hypothetical protein